MKKASREEVIELIQRGESLAGFDLQGVDLQGINLKGANLKGAKLRYANLSGSDLSGANLREANLRHALMRGVNLSGADLREADITHAEIVETNLDNTKASDDKLEGIKETSSKVFFTQKVLDSLNDEDRIEIDGNSITILKPDGAKPKFEIVPACRFIKVEGPEEDTCGLVGKVKTEKEVKEMGVDVYQNSAIYNEVVYEVESGFIGIPVGLRVGEEKPQAAGKEAKTGEKTDEDLLADFIMRHLPG